MALTKATRVKAYGVDTNDGVLQHSLWFLTPEMFKYKEDGSVIGDREAIQAAIYKAHEYSLSGTGPTEVVCNGHYYLTLNPQSLGVSGELAAGRSCINMRSGVTLGGHGTLEMAPFSGTSSGAVITNWEGAVDDCIIRDLTILGGKGSVEGKGIVGINLLSSSRVLIENVRVRHSTNGGIYLRRGFPIGDYGCTDSKILNCHVEDIGYIGYQIEYPNGNIIQGCTARGCEDNGIDVFGNVSGQTGQGVGRGVVITGNSIYDVLNGAFIESCGNTVITGNYFEAFKASGVIYNRINSAANRNVLTSNTMVGVGGSSNGVSFKNSVGNCLIGMNRISDVKFGIRCAGGGILGLNIQPNTFANVLHTLVWVENRQNGLIRSQIEKQFYEGSQTNGVPAYTSPRGVPHGAANRFTYFIGVTKGWSTMSGTLEDNYIINSGNLPVNSGWGGGKSAIYNSVVSGETVVALNSTQAAANQYLNISGSYYKVVQVASSYAVVRKWNGSDYVAGDYTANIANGAAYSRHRAEWGTD